MSQSLAEQLATTALSGGNAGFIEDLYEQFLRDPSGVDPTWAAYFKRLQGGASGEVAHTPIRERLSARLTLPPARSGPQSAESGGASAKQVTNLNVEVLGGKQIAETEPFTFISNDNKYEVVAGARRLRAAQLAELKTVPVRIVQLSDAAAIETP